MSTETTTGPKWRYRGVKGTLAQHTYEVRRADESKPFGMVELVREGGWNSEPVWRARSIADDTVSSSGNSRERAVKELEFNMLPAEERQRIRDEAEAQWQAEQAASDAAADQRKLEALRSPEHQAEALIEAYHVLFDIKDAGDASRVADHKARAAWTAIQALDNLMREAGIDRPRRYDDDGRTVENGGLS